MKLKHDLWMELLQHCEPLPCHSSINKAIQFVHIENILCEQAEVKVSHNFYPHYHLYYWSYLWVYFVLCSSTLVTACGMIITLFSLKHLKLSLLGFSQFMQFLFCISHINFNDEFQLTCLMAISNKIFPFFLQKWNW